MQIVAKLCCFVTILVSSCGKHNPLRLYNSFSHKLFLGPDTSKIHNKVVFFSFRGVSCGGGGLWGPRPPGHYRGAKKEEKGKRKKRKKRDKKEEKKGKNKGGTKREKKNRKINQYNERGAIQRWIKSRCKWRPPPIFCKNRALR